MPYLLESIWLHLEDTPAATHHCKTDVAQWHRQYEHKYIHFVWLWNIKLFYTSIEFMRENCTTSNQKRHTNGEEIVLSKLMILSWDQFIAILDSLRPMGHRDTPCAVQFYINLTQTRVIWEVGTTIKKISPQSLLWESLWHIFMIEDLFGRAHIIPWQLWTWCPGYCEKAGWTIHGEQASKQRTSWPLHLLLLPGF